MAFIPKLSRGLLGLRAYHGSPHDFPAERLVRMPDGTEQYVVGQPDVLPDVPQGAEVLEDFPLGRFRDDARGTGQGEGQLGPGHYVAQNKNEARMFRDIALQNQGMDASMRVGDRPLSDLVEEAFDPPNGPGQMQPSEFWQHGFSPRSWELAQRDQAMLLELLLEQGDVEAVREAIRANPSEYHKAAVQWFENTVAPQFGRKGRLYEVEVDARGLPLSEEVRRSGHPDVIEEGVLETFLDYDEPLANQLPEVAARVQDAMREQFGGEAPEIAKRMLQVPDLIKGVYPKPGPKGQLRERAMVPPDVLQKHGIPGVRKLDDRIMTASSPWNPPTGQWRVTSPQGEAGFHDWLPSEVLDRMPKLERKGWDIDLPRTSNLVVFDPRIIKIVKKYGVAGAATMLGLSEAEVAEAAQGAQAEAPPQFLPDIRAGVFDAGEARNTQRDPFRGAAADALSTLQKGLSYIPLPEVLGGNVGALMGDAPKAMDDLSYGYSPLVTEGPPASWGVRPSDAQGLADLMFMAPVTKGGSALGNALRRSGQP